MGNPSKALGSALERRVVSRAKKRGLYAHRQPGSGVYSDHPNDVVVERLLGECKVRTQAPSLNEMLAWLVGAEANAKKHKMPGAFLVYNRKGSSKPLVLLDLDLFLDILRNGVSNCADSDS